MQRKFVTIGVRRRKKIRIGFIDLDTCDFDIYRTAHGIHLVFRSLKPFDFKFQRLRIAPKIDSKGRTVNPAPELLLCHCPNNVHTDKRLNAGRMELYVTNSK